MPDQAKDIIDPVSIDVGLSPELPGVVSIINCDGRSVIYGLPPEAALAYGQKLIETAEKLLSGSVRVPSCEQVIGGSVTVVRSQADRLDS